MFALVKALSFRLFFMIYYKTYGDAKLNAMNDLVGTVIRIEVLDSRITGLIRSNPMNVYAFSKNGKK